LKCEKLMRWISNLYKLLPVCIAFLVILLISHYLPYDVWGIDRVRVVYSDVCPPQEMDAFKPNELDDNLYGHDIVFVILLAVFAVRMLNVPITRNRVVVLLAVVLVFGGIVVTFSTSDPGVAIIAALIGDFMAALGFFLTPQLDKMIV